MEALLSDDWLRNYLKTPLCHSELVYSVSQLCLVSESPKEGNNLNEILKQVQGDTFLYVLRSVLSTTHLLGAAHGIFLAVILPRLSTQIRENP